MAPRETLVRPEISPLGVIAPPPIHVAAPAFEGSLATLFKCVKEQKVHLLDVPLFPICEAYFVYLLASEMDNLDEAAAALAALAYLLERKAWLLLPTPEPEPEIEDALELPTPSAHEYRLAIEALRLWHDERSLTFFRSAEAGPDPYELPFALGDVGAEDLARAFERVLRKARPDSLESPTKPRRSLSEQMGIVLMALSKEWRTIDRLIDTGATRSEVVYWFLALLELIRLAQASVRLKGDDVEFALSQ